MIYFKDTTLCIGVCAFLVVLLSGCSVSSYQDSNSDLVEENAELALEECGRGNVKEVSIEGFKCK